MKKIIIIPCYNEKDSILSTINKIKNEDPDFDYIVINDCSTDNSKELLEENSVNTINLPINLGIGGAVQMGYIYAYNYNYDIAVQIDADGQHNPRYLSEMLNELVKNNSNIVIGSRFIENKGFQSSFSRRIGIKYFTKLIYLLTKKNITDPTSGFRMVDKELIKFFAHEYPSDYPEPESIVAVLKRGYSVNEIPVQMSSRQGGKSSIDVKKSIYYMIKVSIAILIEDLRSKK